MSSLHKVYLLLGSNMGNRSELLSNALKEIESHAGKILKTSSVYETAPWGVTNQNDYLNQAVLIETSLAPLSLFSELKEIEREAGRTDQKKYAPRTLDIDILFYDDLVLNSEELTIPHPKIQLRKFVLVPLKEIAQELIHPVFKKSVSLLLIECDDTLDVKKIEVT